MQPHGKRLAHPMVRQPFLPCNFLFPAAKINTGFFPDGKAKNKEAALRAKPTHIPSFPKKRGLPWDTAIHQICGQESKNVSRETFFLMRPSIVPKDCISTLCSSNLRQSSASRGGGTLDAALHSPRVFRLQTNGAKGNERKEKFSLTIVNM